MNKLVNTVGKGSTGGDAAGLIDMAIESLSSMAKKQVVGTIIGYAAQKELESKAEQKFVRGFGTQFVLLSLSIAKGAGFPPTFPVALFFTVILYIHNKNEEKRQMMEKELATKLVERAEEIREKALAKVDERHRNELERFLLTQEKHEIEDKNQIWGL